MQLQILKKEDSVFQGFFIKSIRNVNLFSDTFTEELCSQFSGNLSLVMETFLLSMPSCSLGLHLLDLTYTAFTVVSWPLFPITDLSYAYHYFLLTCLEFFHFVAFICIMPGVKINLRICVVFFPYGLLFNSGNNLKKKKASHTILLFSSMDYNYDCLWITFSSVKATIFSTLLQIMKMIKMWHYSDLLEHNGSNHPQECKTFKTINFYKNI